MSSGLPIRPRLPSTGSLRYPDRFIPARSLGADASERFRTGKGPHELTPAEKLLRHGGATEDAFCHRRKIVTPLAPEFRSQARAGTAASRNRLATVLGRLDQNRLEADDGASDSSATGWIAGLGGAAVNDGRGQFVRSGTNARLFRATFPTWTPKPHEELEKHGARLAAALGLDRAQRVLELNVATHRADDPKQAGRSTTTRWNGTEWVNDRLVPRPQRPLGVWTMPICPIRILDAPSLRDDYYCSTLAYCSASHTLAVGLDDLLYSWSETQGTRLLNLGPDEDCYLTSVAFSSPEGCKAILAFGRSNGTLGLLSLYDDPDPATSRSTPMPRFQITHSAAITCLSWKPACTVRPSKSQIHPGTPVKTEDLLVGDGVGHVYYYAVEWPERWEVGRHNWSGQVTLLARIAVHDKQICGLAWSRSGETFATGGNDNLCCLFETAAIAEADSDSRDGNDGHPTESLALSRSAETIETAGVVEADSDSRDSNDRHLAESSSPSRSAETSEISDAETQILVLESTPAYPVSHLRPGDEKHRWVHGAAVKAIAFCPWQESLVATGGGVNDMCIHFFHTRSGAALASISVSAQVTSLIWSTTRREIAATFGYAQPAHPVRIAVFSWPDCRQVAAIPWTGAHRALYAIPYPHEPRDVRQSESGKRASRSIHTTMDGCIVVAASDRSLRFHEVWPAGNKVPAGGVGSLGGSHILEHLEGIGREGSVIR